MLPPSAMNESIAMAAHEQRRRDHYLTEQPWNEPRSEWRRGRAGTPGSGIRFGRRLLNGVAAPILSRFFTRRRPTHPPVIASQ
jgi:hypothetical protein